MILEKWEPVFAKRSCVKKEQILEKWEPVFRKDHAQTSMIRKSGSRFYKKIMLKQKVRSAVAIQPDALASRRKKSKVGLTLLL
jgi:hypothetical protein